MNGASSSAAAPVVNLLMLMNGVFISVVQVPIAAISEMYVLFTVPGIPGLPPVESRYTSGFDAGHVYRPVMLKVPSLPVVTVPIGISVDAPAFVVVFTEYNWMVAPEMGDCPPCTTPETCAVGVVARSAANRS